VLTAAADFEHSEKEANCDHNSNITENKQNPWLRLKSENAKLTWQDSVEIRLIMTSKTVPLALPAEKQEDSVNRIECQKVVESCKA
jgi:hypothetical protein